MNIKGYCNHCGLDGEEFVVIVEGGERIKLCKECYLKGIKSGVFLKQFVVESNVAGIVPYKPEA